MCYCVQMAQCWFSRVCTTDSLRKMCSIQYMCRLAIYAHSIVITVVHTFGSITTVRIFAILDLHFFCSNKLQQHHRYLRNFCLRASFAILCLNKYEKISFLLSPQCTMCAPLWEYYTVNLLAHNWVVGIWKFFRLTPCLSATAELQCMIRWFSYCSASQSARHTFAWTRVYLSVLID